jgi:hypothetical protein
MAADLYLREVDVLRFEVSTGHGVEQDSCHGRVTLVCAGAGGVSTYMRRC